MQFVKFAVLFSVLCPLGAASAAASPSQSGLTPDAMNKVQDAARQFAMNSGAESGLLETGQGAFGASFGLGSAPLQSRLGSGVGKDWRSFIPAHESVDVSASRADSDHVLHGNDNTQIEHESLDVELVPEPASLVAWSLIGGAFCIGAWQRRSLRS
jgi:hypothetical protein